MGRVGICCRLHVQLVACSTVKLASFSWLGLTVLLGSPARLARINEPRSDGFHWHAHLSCPLELLARLVRVVCARAYAGTCQFELLGQHRGFNVSFSHHMVQHYLLRFVRIWALGVLQKPRSQHFDHFWFKTWPTAASPAPAARAPAPSAAMSAAPAPRDATASKAVVRPPPSAPAPAPAATAAAVAPVRAPPADKKPTFDAALTAAGAAAGIMPVVSVWLR